MQILASRACCHLSSSSWQWFSRPWAFGPQLAHARRSSQPHRWGQSEAHAKRSLKLPPTAAWSLQSWQKSRQSYPASTGRAGGSAAANRARPARQSPRSSWRTSHMSTGILELPQIGRSTLSCSSCNASRSVCSVEEARTGHVASKQLDTCQSNARDNEVR